LKVRKAHPTPAVQHVNPSSPHPEVNPSSPHPEVLHPVKSEIIGKVSRKVIVGPDGREYPASHHYIGKDGKVYPWSTIEKYGHDYLKPHEYPDEKIHGSDPRMPPLPTKGIWGTIDKFLDKKLKDEVGNRNLPKKWTE